MQHVFIINPTAGKANIAEYMAKNIDRAAQKTGVGYVIEYTRAAAHATELARRYANSGEPVRLYACGGDGTLNEVMEGAYPFPNAQVAPVSCGSGNDLVKNFGGPEDFLDIASLIDGQVVPIDLMKVNDRIGVNICSVGLDAAVAYSLPNYRRLPLMGGKMGYNLAIAERLFQPLGDRLTIDIDGKVITGDFLLACFSNGICYGGGYYSTPLARLDDGILDIILVRKLSRLRIAGIIAKYKQGLHIENGQIIPSLQKDVQFLRGRRVQITAPKDFIANTDGECGPLRSFTVEVMPLAGRLVVPKPLAEKYALRP